MIRTLEELSINAWPSLETLLYGGWVLRFANGYTRRANSINPLYPSASSGRRPSTRGVDEKITACEDIYRARNQRVVFKMTRAVFPENLDELLAQRGYASEATTSVQVLDLRGAEPPTNRNVIVAESLTAGWLDDFCRLNTVVAQHRATMTQMLEKIVSKRCFITLREEDRVVACGLGVAETGFIGLFDLVTDAAFRNRGLGKELVLNLLDWGKQKGAARAYLQVMLNNAPALRLYDKLGFKEVYQYWYRVKA